MEPSIPSYEEKNGATTQVAKHELSSLRKEILFVYIDIAYNTNSKREEGKNSLEFSFADVESLLDCVKSYCVYVLLLDLFAWAYYVVNSIVLGVDFHSPNCTNLINFGF